MFKINYFSPLIKVFLKNVSDTPWYTPSMHKTCNIVPRPLRGQLWINFFFKIYIIRHFNVILTLFFIDLVCGMEITPCISMVLAKITFYYSFIFLSKGTKNAWKTKSSEKRRKNYLFLPRDWWKKVTAKN